VGALVAFPAIAQATITITVGNHNLLPNTAGQTVDILVSTDASEGVNSMDLSIIENNFVGGGPVMTALLLDDAATIWAASPSTQFGGIDPPSDTELFNSVAVDSTSTNVPLSGVLARIIVDTTGIPVGSYPLEIGRQDGSIGPTTLFATTGQLSPIIIEGSLNIVPEPSSVVLGMFGVAALGMVVIRRRRIRSA
jgi:hypothetical protein